MDFAATDKVMKKNKQCTIKFCHKCLSLRCGENAERVDKLDDWVFPQCKGICNCSVCMTSQVLNPTEILAQKAKACGLAPVSQLLEVEGTDKFAYQKKPKLDVTSMEDADKEKKKVVRKSKKAKSNNKLQEEIKI